MSNAILVTKTGTQQRDLYHRYCFDQMAGGVMHAAWLLKEGGPDKSMHFQEVNTSGHCVFCHRVLSAEPPDLLKGLRPSLP